ncbi:lytic transglycosylase domain-containing protein [Pseudomonas fluvialis]|uniref:Lytic transglycosylase domain-containing protein n=1 Tax=Pseudomonas fluvialis TaxID=1793966 RepID=A0A2I0CMQ5_9PSED|nr:transglycosylase SLT domain-containing protein [Pseudomonas pharmacofabricae]PKF70430.1 lytic transglycosylase domain-containing protein [Pseudomonas pharmacofabricae]
MTRLKRWLAEIGNDLYIIWMIEPRLFLWPLFVLLVVLGCSMVPSADAAIPTAAEQHRRTLVRAAHAEWGLGAPVATFAAQVHQESAWRVNARSPVGAQGLAQFMPATADWMAEIYPRSLGPAQPYNPGWALRAMVAFDRWLYERNQAVSECDRWAFVMAGYNGGNGWVNRDRRLASAKGADPLAWFGHVERHNSGRSASNFKENRHYPRAILLRWEPMYVAAGWGPGVCAERYRHDESTTAVPGDEHRHYITCSLLTELARRQRAVRLAATPRPGSQAGLIPATA